MTPAELHRIHARAMRHGRVWSAQEFESLLSEPVNFLVSRDHGFALGRTVLDEAELLTIAVDPAHQGRGIGAACMADFLREIAARGCRTAFLEVAEDNVPALRLYEGTGWETVGRRPGYYATPGHAAVDGLTMRWRAGAG